LMNILSRLKLLNAVTPPAVTLGRSFTAKGMYLHESFQGLNLNRRSITGLETEMPVTQLSTCHETENSCVCSSTVFCGV
jgi:hypothetical protein